MYFVLGVGFVGESIAKRGGCNIIAIKACILLAISIAALLSLEIVNASDSDLKSLIYSCQLFADSLCLFFMFPENELRCCRSGYPKYKIQSDAVDTEEGEALQIQLTNINKIPKSIKIVFRQN